MSALAVQSPVRADGGFALEVLEHLSAQISSARRLLELVLEQGAAIRARDVQEVVRLAGILRGEMGRRALLEEQRSSILRRSGELLGVAAAEVRLGELTRLMDEPAAARASSLSAELRGLLHELQREHTCNRAIMQVELGFLDHLLGMLSLDGVSGYDPRGSSTSITRPRVGGALHVLDLHA